MKYGSHDLNLFNASVSEIESLYHLAAQRCGVSDSVQHILYVVCALGDGCTQADICRIGGMSKQTINSAIRQMEREGLLTLTESTRRSRAIQLTDSGRALMQRVARPLVECENAILASWTREDRETYLRLNQRYADEFRTHISKMFKEESP